MVAFHRARNIYRLCIYTVLTIFLISVWNFLHMIRNSFSNEEDQHMAGMSRQNYNTSLLNNQADPNEKNIDFFYETYQAFLQVYNNKNLQKSDDHNSSTSLCPPIPPTLKGPHHIHEPPDDFSLHRISEKHPDIQMGGYYHPKTCVARHKVAIIVPYRDRWYILERFLFHTHIVLQRQQIEYRIFVCEQAYDKIFNKGIVMNGCFKEILNLVPDITCFIMHDVDLLLMDDRNMYTCPQNPRHLSVAIDKFHFYLPYNELVGGVLAMRREHYLLVNGYSTNYWGWGGEDDDMHKRIVKKKLILERPPPSIARYKMLKHTHQRLNPARMKVLRLAQIRMNSDGVNNVKYKLLNTTFYHLYTNFLIDVGEQHGY